MNDAPEKAEVKMDVYDLRVDDRVEPLTVTSTQPRLSWRMRPGREAPAFVLVEAASNREALLSGSADLWRSLLTPFDGPSLIWDGTLLASRDRVSWRVAVLASAYDRPIWSVPATFEIPLITDEDWVARWITHPAWIEPTSPAPALPVLCTNIFVEDRVIAARAFVSGAGVFAMTINGVPASRAKLSPGYSNPSRRIGAVAWDVTDAFRAGGNVVEVELGTGMAFVERLPGRYTKLDSDFVRPRALVQIELELADGSRRVVGSGADWTSYLGSTTVAHWYGGEDMDARRLTGAAAEHVPAVELGAAALHARWWSEHPPIETVDTLRPVDVTRFDDGVLVLDFGVNIAGVPELNLRNAAEGRLITIRPGEILDPQGRVTQWSTGGPTWDSYTSRDGDQSWNPRFVYHGFRYLEVAGLESDDTIAALVWRANNTVAGRFTSSDPFLQTLHGMIDRAVQGNMHSVFTDCPHREKLGWLEQLHLCFDTLARGYDVNAHLRDELVHIGDAQLPNGAIPNIAPEVVDFSGIEYGGDPNAFREDPNWGGAVALVPWRLYETYEDRAALERSWPTILRYLAYLDARALDGILDFGLGDWIALDKTTPRAMVATFGYGCILDAAARIADVLGDGIRDSLKDQAERVRSAFRSAFGPHTGTGWGSGSQASLALALDFVQLDGAEYAGLLADLVGLIEDGGFHVTVGENALPSLLRVLHANGRDDVINRFVRVSDGAGYGYQVERGLTALAEKWTVEDGDGVDASLNHFMLGMIDGWMTGAIAGLTQDAGSTGWRRIRVRPIVLPEITHASTIYASPFGEIHVSWTAGATFALDVTVPPGVTGTVHVPCLAGYGTVRNLDGLDGTDDTSGFTAFEIGAGAWRFESGR